MKTAAGLLLIAAVASAGDYIWYTFGVRHRMTAGLIHGAGLLTVVGAVLGLLSGRLLRGLPIGALAGVGGALSYYLLISVMDRRTYGTAIPAAWVIMWLLLAAMDGRWLRRPQRAWPAIAGRGLAAAVLGGVALFLVMTTLWGPPPAGGRNYLVQFAAWAFAWAPGLLALTWGGPSATAIRASPSGSGRRAPGDRSVDSAATRAEGAITPATLLARIDRQERVHILDVRSEREFEDGHVPGAVNVPFTQVLGRMREVPGAPDDELIVYCGHGPRAYIAATALRSGGREKIVYLTGHWARWQTAGLREERSGPTEKSQ